MTTPPATAKPNGHPARRRGNVRLAWALCALVVGFGAVGLALALAGPNAPRTAPALVKTALDYVSPVVFGVVAALIVAHQPRNTVGWLLMMVALGWTIAWVIVDYLSLAMTAMPDPSLAILLNAWFSEWNWWLAVGPLLLILLLFPTGRPPSPRWRWAIVAVAALFGIFLLSATFAESLVEVDSGVRLHNPLGIVPDSVIERFFSGPWSIMLLTTVACCVAAVFVRYRRAAAQERAQIKWFLYACALFLIIYPIGSFVSSNDCWSIVFDLMVLTIPTSIGIAILRYRLYDIDIIIRRTLVYSTLTLTLGLVYLGCIVVSRTLIAPYIGGSDAAIVASTLAIAALFTPLRRRIQNIIDKRFYRRKYDAAKVLAAFGATARDETDLERLTAELLRVVDATMQPASVGLWLREPSTTAGGAPPQSGNTIGARFEHTTRSSLIERSDENETMKSSLPLRHAQEPAGPAKVSTPIGQILFDRSISRYLPWSLPSILLAGAVLVPLALWLLYADLGSRFGQPAAALKSLANLCALTGTAAFAVSVILGARLKLVERALGGADQLYRAHRRIGAATPLLLAGHALFVVASKAIASLPAGLLLFTPLAGWDVFLGVIAFAGLVAALLFPRLRTLKHEAFVLLHRALGVAFLVGGLHVLLVPATWALASPLIAYLLALLAAGALAFVYRSALGRFLIRRHRYQIAEVNRLGESAVELVLAPAGATMPFLPGQFAFLTILDERLPREAHPFSITSAPSDPRVRMVVKALGDYTTRLLDLRPGGAALLEGPYGGCSYRRVANRRQIWIAGGVGVTPFLSMARSLGGTPYDIDFYYCTERTEDAFFLDELFVLSDQTPQLRIIPIRKISLGHITVDDLQAASGDLPRYDILLCGPPVMMRNLRAQLQARGVPPAQIHFEDFAAMAV